MRVFLVDNGSLRPDSWINLCRVAEAVGTRVEMEVEPASVLHSTRMDPELIPPRWPRPTTWERGMKAALKQGECSFLVLPFFFGPTGALTSYLPRRAEALRERFGPFSLRFAGFLADPVEGDISLAGILAERVREVRRAGSLEKPRVLLVDHGSPRREVTAVRDRLGLELEERLGGEAAGVRVASMERREGAEYDFNEPLLERALRDPALPPGDLVVSMLFLSPGRHAGPDGDVARICAGAQRERPGLRVHRTELVGTHPGVVELLEQHFRRAMSG